jgi:hypothetical protein
MFLALSDEQLSQIMVAAAMVSPNDRQNFLRSVAGQLAHTQPTDRELADALTLILAKRNVSVSSMLFLKQPIKEKFKCGTKTKPSTRMAS